MEKNSGLIITLLFILLLVGCGKRNKGGANNEFASGIDFSLKPIPVIDIGRDFKNEEFRFSEIASDIVNSQIIENRRKAYNTSKRSS